MLFVRTVLRKIFMIKNVLMTSTMITYQSVNENKGLRNQMSRIVLENQEESQIKDHHELS